MSGSLLSSADNPMHLMCGIEKEYGFNIKEMKQFDGSGCIVETNIGLLRAEKTEFKEARLLFLTGIYEYISSRGFENILKMYKSRSEKYYFNYGNGQYIVSEYAGDKESMTFRGNESGIIRLLARFHKASSGYIPPSGSKGKSCWGRWIERQKKECRDIKSFRDDLNNKSCKTPFDIMFLSDCDSYIDRMEKSIKLMVKEGYLDSVEESMRNHQVCLGNFKQSNFYNSSSGICIKSLDKCRYDMVERDISELLKKMAESRSIDLKQKIGNLMEDYYDENMLLDNSINIIKAFLLYPEEYKKISSKRSRGKDKWTEGEYMEKLREAMRLDDKLADIAKGIG